MGVLYPLPAGFPRNRSPLKGNPPFRGTPSALGHEGVRGRRLHGAAMLCRLQCARFAKRKAHCRRTSRQPSALIRSPRRSRGGYAACERLVSGSTPNKITSCQGTSRSGCALFRLRKRFHRARGRSEQVHVWRLHFELDNVVSSDVTLGVRIIPSLKEKRRARGCSIRRLLV